MRVVMYEAPPDVEAMLAERRRLGLDVFDEMWDGVLHIVPPPGGRHQQFGSRFLRVAGPLADARGLDAQYETGLFRTADDYRVPDLVFFRTEHFSERGVEGAELVLEIRSPRDETYEKIDFYSGIGVREMIVAHPEERRVELFRSVGGRLMPVQPGPDGVLASEVLGLTLRTVDGTLEITWDGGSATV